MQKMMDAIVKPRADVGLELRQVPVPVPAPAPIMEAISEIKFIT